MRASAKDLRLRTRQVLAAVERGEQVTITHRGKPKARLVPLPKADARTQATGLFGIWADRADLDVVAHVDALRKSR